MSSSSDETKGDGRTPDSSMSLPHGAGEGSGDSPSRGARRGAAVGVDGVSSVAGTTMWSRSMTPVPIAQAVRLARMMPPNAYDTYARGHLGPLLEHLPDDITEHDGVDRHLLFVTAVFGIGVDGSEPTAILPPPQEGVRRSARNKTGAPAPHPRATYDPDAETTVEEWQTWTCAVTTSDAEEQEERASWEEPKCRKALRKAIKRAASALTSAYKAHKSAKAAADVTAELRRATAELITARSQGTGARSHASSPPRLDDHVPRAQASPRAPRGDTDGGIDLVVPRARRTPPGEEAPPTLPTLGGATAGAGSAGAGAAVTGGDTRRSATATPTPRADATAQYTKSGTTTTGVTAAVPTPVNEDWRTLDPAYNMGASFAAVPPGMVAPQNALLSGVVTSMSGFMASHVYGERRKTLAAAGKAQRAALMFLGVREPRHLRPADAYNTFITTIKIEASSNFAYGGPRAVFTSAQLTSMAQLDFHAVAWHAVSDGSGVAYGAATMLRLAGRLLGMAAQKAQAIEMDSMVKRGLMMNVDTALAAPHDWTTVFEAAADGVLRMRARGDAQAGIIRVLNDRFNDATTRYRADGTGTALVAAARAWRALPDRAYYSQLTPSTTRKGGVGGGGAATPAGDKAAASVDAAGREVCRNFHRGRCRFGDKCKRSHAPAVAGGTK